MAGSLCVAFSTFHSEVPQPGKKPFPLVFFSLKVSVIIEVDFFLLHVLLPHPRNFIRNSILVFLHSNKSLNFVNCLRVKSKENERCKLEIGSGRRWMGKRICPVKALRKKVMTKKCSTIIFILRA